MCICRLYVSSVWVCVICMHVCMLCICMCVYSLCAGGSRYRLLHPPHPPHQELASVLHPPHQELAWSAVRLLDSQALVHLLVPPSISYPIIPDVLPYYPHRTSDLSILSLASFRGIILLALSCRICITYYP